MSSLMAKECSITIKESMRDSTMKEKNMERVDLFGMMAHPMKEHS